MIYKTLHWYILREMLRVFFLTAGTLTTLLAFGGTFKPLTKEGLEVPQLMLVLMNLMPAMLAYAIPLAALFAAVLTYWRLSTDNEITACRAGGISFRAIVFPALVLGLLVASADLLFLNYVVPLFLQRSEMVARADLGSVIVHNVGLQEPFAVEQYVVYADSAEQQRASAADTPPGVDSRTIVRLQGLAAAHLGKDGQSDFVVVGQTAYAIIDEDRTLGETRARVELQGSTMFRRGDANTFSKAAFSARSLPLDGSSWTLPSVVANRPKFLDWFQLATLQQNPRNYAPVGDAYEQIARLWRDQKVAERLMAQWQPGQPLPFQLATGESITIAAPRLRLGPNQQLLFEHEATTPVIVEQLRNGAKIARYKCDTAEFTLVEADEALTPGTAPGAPWQGALNLTGSVERTDLRRNLGAMKIEDTFISGIALPPEASADLARFPEADLRNNPGSFARPLQELQWAMQWKITQLFNLIGSELHSRGSFSLSCLTLVLLGAALGIMLRGRNPLAVFVVGFLPAIVLVILITTGRQMVETTYGSVVPGYVVIWAGNLLLLALLVAVYSKLLRQ